MKKESIKKLLEVERDLDNYNRDKTELKMLIEEVLIAECGEDELSEATNTSVSYK